MRIFLLREGAGEGIYRLSSKEKNYLTRVLRLEINSTFTAKDRDGRFYKAFLFDGDTLALEPTDAPEETLLDSLSSYKGPFVPINAFISVLKGKKNEIEVRALTEIGVRRIVLMETEFTQAPLSSHQIERIEAIMREAVQQSGSQMPELVGPVSFSEALGMAEGRTLLLHQSALGEGPKSLSDSLSDLDGTSPVSMMIGPEGGFSDRECALACSEGAAAVLLNTNILRAETAAIYTAAAIQSFFQN